MKLISSVVVLSTIFGAFGIPRETPEVRVIPPDGIAQWTNVEVEVCTTEQGKARTALTGAQLNQNYNDNSEAGNYFDSHIQTICTKYIDVNFALFQPVPGNLDPNGVDAIENSLQTIKDMLKQGLEYLYDVDSDGGSSVQGDYDDCKALRKDVIEFMEDCAEDNVSLYQSCNDDKFITALSQFFSLASRTLTEIIQKWSAAI